MATANSTLQPVVERGWRRGLSNLWRNENNLRWGGRRWLVPALVWLVVVNGFVLLIAIGNAQNGNKTLAEHAQEGVQVFVTIGLLATSVGVIIGTQGAIIREKQLGTAAWVLSKPAARSAFILAKFFSYVLFLIPISLALPAVGFYVQSQLLWGQTPALAPFLGGWLIMAIHVLFYLALTLLLGTLFNARGPVTGIGFGFMFAGQILPNFLPQWLTVTLPWSLSNLASALVTGQALPPVWPVPLIATVLWTAVLIALALWRFGREEF